MFRMFHWVLKTKHVCIRFQNFWLISQGCVLSTPGIFGRHFLSLYFSKNNFPRMSCFPKKNDVWIREVPRNTGCYCQPTLCVDNKQDVTSTPHPLFLSFFLSKAAWPVIAISHHAVWAQISHNVFPPCFMPRARTLSRSAVVFEATEDNIGCFEEKVCKNRIGKKNEESGC